MSFEAISARLVAREDWSCSQHNETPKMVVGACCNANGITTQRHNLSAKESPPDRLKSPWDCSFWVLKQSRRDWLPGWIGVVLNTMRPPKCLSELVSMQKASPCSDTTSLQWNLHRICSILRGIAHLGFEAILARLVARVDWSCSKRNETPKLVVRAC